MTNDELKKRKLDIQKGTGREFDRDEIEEIIDDVLSAREDALATEKGRSSWERAALEAREQLPAGMKHCTIIFKECSVGHGWLTATSWVQHGCPHCKIAALRAELKQREARDYVQEQLEDPAMREAYRREWANEESRVLADNARAVAFEEAIRALSRAAIKDAGVLWSIQTIRALATLPPTLQAVPVCHICGSSDAVITSRAPLCSRGHFSDPTNLPGTHQAVPEEVVAQVVEALKHVFDAVEKSEDIDVDRIRSALKALEVKP